ncbi:MAG: hypothetical protein CMM77_05105 [Rhodospirillaceae bacterium]|nr:hypothetical protein [Magnetovibrio sp.]MAY66485.1 hypothetical protein [Rhodospirillaceae bacterium]
MAAYVIAQIDVTDPETFKEYQAQVPATIAAFGGEYIVRGGEQVALEGTAPSSRTVVLRFPDMATAQAWYASPEYAKPLAIRMASAKGTLFVVDGVD